MVGISIRELSIGLALIKILYKRYIHEGLDFFHSTVLKRCEINNLVEIYIYIYGTEKRGFVTRKRDGRSDYIRKRMHETLLAL